MHECGRGQGVGFGFFLSTFASSNINRRRDPCDCMSHRPRVHAAARAQPHVGRWALASHVAAKIVTARRSALVAWPVPMVCVSLPLLSLPTGQLVQMNRQLQRNRSARQ